MNKKTQDILIVGFALFAIFFGAGNLIFPPYLGITAGNHWKEATLGFLITDPVLPILGVIVTAYVGGKADDLGKRVYPGFSKLLGAVAIITVGPIFSVPRTGATSHEIAVMQILPGTPLVATSIVFFGLTLFLALNPSGVMDKIGKYLTPGLLIVLAIIVIKAIFRPIGPIVDMPEKNYFLMGFKEGYQTMDALGSSLMTGIVLTDLIGKGYSEKKDQLKMIIGVSFVAFLLLAFVYTGLSYVGATAGTVYSPKTDRIQLLIGSVYELFGNTGKIVLGLAVALACLTTSVGLTATCGNFFEGITNGKLKYKSIVTVCVIVSFCISLLGVEELINLAVPVLSAIYPVFIVLIFMTMFDKWIKYDWTYTGAVIGTLIVSIIQVLNQVFGTMPDLTERIKNLPLNGIGMEWFIPAMICSVIMTAIQIATKKKNIEM